MQRLGLGEARAGQILAYLDPTMDLDQQARLAQTQAPQQPQFGSL